MKTPSHNGEKLELESFVCAVHTDSFGRILFYDPHTHEQRPVINGNNRLLMGGSSERLGNAGVQELLHARIRIAFDLIGSADGDYAAFIEHRDALGNPKRQVAIMRYHKGRGMKTAFESSSLPWIERSLCRQLFPQKLILLADVGRDLNRCLDIKITAFGTASGQPLAPDAQFLSLLKTGGNFNGNTAFQGLHGNRRSQYRLPWGQLQMAHQIGTAHLPIRMLGIAHP
jgi:hypothetical protein